MEIVFIKINVLLKVDFWMFKFCQNNVLTTFFKKYLNENYFKDPAMRTHYN